MPRPVAAHTGGYIAQLSGPSEPQGLHQRALGAVFCVPCYEQIGEVIEQGGTQRLHGIVLGVAAEIVHYRESLCGIARGQGAHKLESVVILRYADIALYRLRSDHSTRSETHGEFADLVVETRKVGPHIIAQHGQGLWLDGEAARFHKISHCRPHGAVVEFPRYEVDTAPLGQCLEKLRALGLGSAETDAEHSCGARLGHIMRQSLEIGRGTEPRGHPPLRLAQYHHLPVGHHRVAAAGLNHSGRLCLRRIQHREVEIAVTFRHKILHAF